MATECHTVFTAIGLFILTQGEHWAGPILDGHGLKHSTLVSLGHVQVQFAS